MKRFLLLLMALVMLMPVDDVSAASPNIQILEEEDPFNTIIKSYYHNTQNGNDGFTVDVRDKSVYKVYVSSYDSGFNNQGTEKVTNPGGGRYLLKYTLTCNVSYILKFYNRDGKEIYHAKLVVTGLQNPACDSSGNENDDNLGGGNADCDICNAMGGIKDAINGNGGKLDQIIDKIPPPPNWQNVANIMRDTIVPKLVGDTKDMLDDLLGRAPAPPPMPVQPAPPPDVLPPSTGNMPQAPSVDLPPESNDNSFSSSDILNDAPTIPYEEPPDDEQGFDLTVDPIENLKNPGSPGEPKEMEDVGKPKPPKEQDIKPGKPNVPDYNPGRPGKPNDDIGKPGKPNDGDFRPSNPGDGIGSPPDIYNPR